jgi:hypothetical protein
MTEALFPRIVERGASPEELLAQHELAQWTLCALQEQIKRAGGARELEAPLINDKNETTGVARVLAERVDLLASQAL